jgi:hypothetical protein
MAVTALKSSLAYANKSELKAHEFEHSFLNGTPVGVNLDERPLNVSYEHALEP